MQVITRVCAYVGEYGLGKYEYVGLPQDLARLLRSNSKR